MPACSTPARAARSFAESAFARFDAGLQRFLVQRLRSAEDARDIAQEAYLRLLRVESTELVRKPQAYLYRIACNVIYEFKLRAERDPVTFDSEVVERLTEESIQLPTDDLSDRLHRAQAIERILSQLPPTYRAVLILRKRDGLSYHQIAKILDLSPHTVKKYLARALAQCRAAPWDASP